MQLWERFVRAGRAFVTAFNENALVPSEQAADQFDLFASRMLRYYVASSYYHNTVYKDIFTHAAQLKADRGLYKFTRGIYNPTQRLVDFYPAKVYGGMLDLEDMTGGAIPIVTKNQRVKDAVKQLWKWSNWGVEKSLWVRYGAMYGDAPIKLVDDRAAGKVRMEVLHPCRIKDIEMDAVANVKRVVIEYEKTEEKFVDPRRDITKLVTYVYTEVIDGEWFETFKDGEPFAYFPDASGKLVSRWPNEYGFVPLVLAHHRKTGKQWGENALGSSTPKIDEINDAASLLNDQIRKAVNALWYFAGVAKKNELSATTEAKDQLAAIYGPAGSKPEPMIAPIDIAAAMDNIQKMLEELERDQPELSLHRLRSSGGDLSAPGVRAAYGDAFDKVIEARGNYDDTLVRAHMMGLTMGGINRYAEFESFISASYNEGDLQHTIGDRPLVQDTISLMDKVGVLKDTGAPAQAIWKELGYSEDVIDDWTAELENDPVRIEQRVNAEIAMLAARNSGDQPNDNPRLITSGGASDANANAAR